MKKAISGRQTGKTEKLIKLASTTGGVIITFHRESARSILHKANKMGLVIQTPIDINTLISDNYRNNMAKKMTNVIIDDADLVLKIMLQKFNVESVDAIAMCNDNIFDELL